jgi:transposase
VVDCPSTLILEGQVHDSKAVPELINKLPDAEHFIADRGYDSESIQEQIRTRNAIAVISRKRNSKMGNADINWCLYKYGYLVESVFARLKHYRAMAISPPSST